MSHYLKHHSQLHTANARILLFILLASLLTIPTTRSTAQNNPSCPGSLLSQLAIGGIAIVSPGAPNNLRTAPNLSAQVIDKLGEGAQIMVIGGPTCADGYLWWQVKQWPDESGWMVEGHGSNYYLLPFAAPVTSETKTFTMPEQAASMNVSFEGISFTYNGFAGPSVKVNHSLEWWNYMGTWVELYDFQFSDDAHVASNISIVKNASHYFGQSEITKFAQQLKAHLTYAVSTPIDYIHGWWGADQMLHAQEKYLTFKNTHGLRFIAQYVQAYVQIDGKSLRYEFIGLSSDDHDYIWATFDTSTTLLADSYPDDNIPIGFESDKDPVYRTYIAQTAAKLQKGIANDFTLYASANPKHPATITDLDQMLGTLTITH